MQEKALSRVTCHAKLVCRMRDEPKECAILYLHNTIILRFYPPPPPAKKKKKLHRHCFRFPVGHLHVPREIANNHYDKFWGVKEVYYGICASREFGAKGEQFDF